MENILHELYYGNICPSEGRFPKVPEYKAALEDITQAEEKFLAILNEEGKELYHKLTMAEIPRSSIEKAYDFEDAFKLGAKIMLSCFIDSELR